MKFLKLKGFPLEIRHCPTLAPTICDRKDCHRPTCSFKIADLFLSKGPQSPVKLLKL